MLKKIGAVDTVYKFLGSNHKIIVEAFDDSKVSGVTCHLSRAKIGEISESLGIAEDKAEASIACRQIGPIKLPLNLQSGESVVSKKASLVFVTIQVDRFYDKKRNVLIYLVYSDKLIEGSPKNSISTVPNLKWKL